MRMPHQTMDSASHEEEIPKQEGNHELGAEAILTWRGRCCDFQATLLCNHQTIAILGAEGFVANELVASA